MCILHIISKYNLISKKKSSISFAFLGLVLCFVVVLFMNTPLLSSFIAPLIDYCSFIKQVLLNGLPHIGLGQNY